MLPRLNAAERKRFEKELALHRTLLRRLIAASGFSLEDMDRKFGYGRSYLSRLLSGDTALTVYHVLAILEAINYPPASYFSALYPPPERRPDWQDDFLRTLHRLEEHLTRVPEGAPPGPETPPRSREERIDQAIDEVLRGVRSRPGPGQS